MDGKAVSLMIRFKDASGSWKRRPAARGANGRVKSGHALIDDKVVAVKDWTYDLRYGTMTLEEIKSLPISRIAATQSHLYLWVPNALILEGFEVMKRWGFTYKTNIVWHKIRKDGGPDGRGVGFYFRNVTELILFGTRGSLRTAAPGR